MRGTEREGYTGICSTQHLISQLSRFAEESYPVDEVILQDAAYTVGQFWDVLLDCQQVEWKGILELSQEVNWTEVMQRNENQSPGPDVMCHCPSLICYSRRDQRSEELVRDVIACGSCS